MSGNYSTSVGCTTTLTNYLNTNYSAFVDPTLGSNVTAIPILVQSLLLNFLGLDTDKTLSTVMFLYFSWRDLNLPDLKTTCGAYFNQSMSLNSSLMWTPDIFLAGSATDSTALTYWWSTGFGYFDNNTNVQPTILTQVTSTCTSMKIANFPYDTQSCDITFFASTDPVVFISDYAYNGVGEKSNDWNVQSIDLNVGNYSLDAFTYPSFTVTIVAARDAYYFVINLVIPTACMAAMLCLVFIMPCDEGEKTLLSATLVLGLYVLQQTISVILPDVSDSDVPIILYITTLVFICSVVSLFEAVIIQTVCLVAPESFPKYINEAMVKVFIRCCKKEEEEDEDEGEEGGKTTEITDEVEVQPGTVTESDPQLTLLRELIRLQKQKLAVIKKQNAEAEEHELYETAWFRFQYVVNVLFLIAYIIAIAIPFAQLNAAIN